MEAPSNGVAFDYLSAGASVNTTTINVMLRVSAVLEYEYGP